MDMTRDTLLDASSRSSEDLADDYVFLRLGDLPSLAFCTNSTDPQTFDGWTVQLAADRLTVTPDGFDGDVSFSVIAREVADVAHRSDSELRALLHDAPTRVLHGTVAGRPVR